MSLAEQAVRAGVLASATAPPPVPPTAVGFVPQAVARIEGPAARPNLPLDVALPPEQEAAILRQRLAEVEGQRAIEVAALQQRLNLSEQDALN